MTRRDAVPPDPRAPSTRVRAAVPDDAPAVASLVAAYLAERHPGHPGTPAATLARDVLSGASGHRVLVAERGGSLSGSVAWDRVYDLHWAKAGIQIADLYVVPERRGGGTALRLLLAACADAGAEGAAFVRGAAYERGSRTGRLYERLAVGFDSAECHCGGRAFRTLAGLAGLAPRDAVRRLPPREWNHEP